MGIFDFHLRELTTLIKKLCTRGGGAAGQVSAELRQAGRVKPVPPPLSKVEARNPWEPPRAYVADLPRVETPRVENPETDLPIKPPSDAVLAQAGTVVAGAGEMAGDEEGRRQFRGFPTIKQMFDHPETLAAWFEKSEWNGRWYYTHYSSAEETPFQDHLPAYLTIECQKFSEHNQTGWPTRRIPFEVQWRLEPDGPVVTSLSCHYELTRTDNGIKAAFHTFWRKLPGDDLDALESVTIERAEGQLARWLEKLDKIGIRHAG